jgi:hypothetical protein
MSATKKRSSRRDFFLQGSAVLGAGVATTAAAAALTQENAVPPGDELEQLRRQLASAEDREAIRQLHSAFTRLIEQRHYQAAAELVDERARFSLSGVSASGRTAIAQLFGDQATAMHSAYRHNSTQPIDAVTIREDTLQATAIFHTEVELCTPLQEDCTAAQMARLQGNVADRHWEAGRFEGTYVKTSGGWRIASLSYIAP